LLSRGCAKSSSAPKQVKKSTTTTKRKLPPAANKPGTQAVNVLTAEVVSEAVKEAQVLETDNSEEGVFQASLSTRGWESKDIPSEYLDVAYFYNFKKSGGLKPLARAKVMPKLMKQRIPMYILVELSSAQLTEMLYLIIRIKTKAQLLGMPHYIPGPYRNKNLSTTMFLEKICYLSPAAHFVILRNPSFFTLDQLGIQQEFYEIVLITSIGRTLGMW
jgi:hypothetical protein